MPDIGWQELLIIGAIAIIVVGPRELPLLMRTVGRWVGRARAMATDFQRSMDDLAHETELENLRRSIDEIGVPDPTGADPDAAAIHGGIATPSLPDETTMPLPGQISEQERASRSGTGNQ